MATTAVFHWIDYLVFAAILLVSLSIGIFYAYRDRKRNTVEEYLMGSRKMPVLPVSVSMFVSYLSALSFLGDPVESYNYGWVFLSLGLGNVLSMVPVAFFVAPLFNRDRITSTFEVLGRRYNQLMQTFVSVLYIVQSTMWCSMVLYIPSIALSQVSGLPVLITIVSLGAASTLYTSTGGMKAVVWADTAQVFIMLTGMVAVLVRGTMAVGGVEQIWRVAVEDKRLNLEFSPSPLLRSTFWTYFIGGFYRSLCPYIANQHVIQRFCTLKTPRDATKAVLLNIPFYLIAIPMFGFVGQIMYTYFRNCDPLLEGRIQRADQLLPLMAMELLGPFYGMPGLFLAAVCCASLSSLSSGQTAIVTCVMKDIIEPIHGRIHGINHYRLPDKSAVFIGKIMVAILGVILIGTARLTMLADGEVFQMTMKTLYVIQGPSLGIFLLAFFFPCVSGLVAFLGAISSFALGSWISLGSTLHPPPSSKLPLNTMNCTDMYNLTSTYATATTVTAPLASETSSSWLSDAYKFSPLLLGASCTILCMAISLFITGVSELLARFGRTRSRPTAQEKCDQQELETQKPLQAEETTASNN